MARNRKIKLLILFLLLFIFLGLQSPHHPLAESEPLASFAPVPEQNSVRDYPELNSVLVRGVLAQKPLEITYPQIPGATTPTTTKEALPDYIRYVFQFSLYLGALIAFSSFIYGGVRYLTSAGNLSRTKDAKSQIAAGFLGLIILISAYLILNTINPQLVAWEVSLPGGTPAGLPAAGPSKPEPTTYVEIPLGGLIENLWGERSEIFPKGFKPTQCYQFNDNGDRTTDEPLENQERLDCIKWLSKAIQIKAENLKEPVEELQKLYDCQNCCRDCCKDVCDWAECKEICDLDEVTGLWKHCPLGNLCCEGTQNEGCWESCDAYQCCEGRGMVQQYSYQKCPYSCCEFFEECPCSETCGFETEWCNRCNCICIKEDEEGKPVCCNFEEDSTKPYEDLLVRSLIDKNLLSEEEKENDPFKDLVDIKTALKELRLTLGLFPLTEALKNNQRICCPGDSCPPEIGVIDCLLKNTQTKDLIKKILLGDLAEEEFTTIDEEKLKEILGIPLVMRYLVESGLLTQDRNAAKIMMRELGIRKNEVAFNEIGWMGTLASPNDEWIELYNNTRENINFETESGDWRIKTVSGTIDIKLRGIIPTGSFYLLANNENVFSDTEVNLVYEGKLADEGEILILYDEFGNPIEEMDCGLGWFGGDKELKISMERMNPQGCLNMENWTTNFSAKVQEVWRPDYINGLDQEGNPIYGTPGQPNSAGRRAIPYPDFNSAVGELSSKLSQEEELRKKLVLVLRKEENLNKLVKSKEGLAEVLTGEDWRFKNLLSYENVLRILVEDKSTETEYNFELLLANEYIKEVFTEVLIQIGFWKEGEEEQWEELTSILPITTTNLKLINDFRQDLTWVLEGRDLMKNCENPPISYDQTRVPETAIADLNIEEEPTWKDIKKEVFWIEEGLDPATFYCPKLLW